MVSSTHLLKIVIEVVDNATRKVDMLSQKMRTLDLISKQTSSAMRLAPVGIAFDKHNRLRDIAKGQYISLIDIQKRFIDHGVKGFKKLENSGFRFDMRSLSIMFGMQMLNRAFSIALNSIYTSWVRVDMLQSAVGKGIMRLQANFEYLKFSIFSTLNQNELFKNVLDWLADTIKWVGDLTNKFPELSSAILIGFGVLTAATGVIAILEAFELLWAAFTSKIVGAFALKMGTSAAEAGTLVGVFNIAWAALLGIIGGGLIIDAVMKTDKLTTAKELIVNALELSLGVALLTLAGLAIGGPAGAAVGFIGGIVLAVLTTLFMISNDQMKAFKQQIDELKEYSRDILGLPGGAITSPITVTKSYMGLPLSVAAASEITERKRREDIFNENLQKLADALLTNTTALKEKPRPERGIGIISIGTPEIIFKQYVPSPYGAI